MGRASAGWRHGGVGGVGYVEEGAVGGSLGGVAGPGRGLRLDAVVGGGVGL